MSTGNNKYPQLIDIRLSQLRFTMEDHKVEALVLTHLPNIRYMTNFSGSNAVLFITETELHLLTDDRYEEQIKEELYGLPNLKTHITRDPWTYAIENKILKKTVSLGFEADHLEYSAAINIRNQIRPIKFKPASNLVEPFTQPKADEELEYLKKAAEIAETVYNEMLDFIEPGKTEKEIAAEISYRGRKLGAEDESFDIIVASGERAAFVHGKPTDKKIKKGDVVIMDFGFKVNGFCSDITRTIAVGKATKEQKDVYALLRNAQQKAIEGVRPAMNGKHLDSLARDLIAEAGYGNYFQHSLGHGIGLEAHEIPTITFRMEDQIIPENAVLAIEPGVYIPGKFGMRIEDMIQVTRSGGVKITNAPDELVIIDK
jgi:Xaa-Pro aminopeptidase